MASPNISFDTIPSSIRKPGVYTEINTSLAVRALPANAQPTVIVAQRTSSGSVAANVSTTVFSDADASLYFGAGSTAHRMAKAALDANPYLDLDIVAMDDAGGSAAAAGFFLFTGVAAAAGVIVANVDNKTKTLAIASGDTAAVSAAALYTALSEYNNQVAVTIGITGNCVKFTSNNKGTCGNYVPVTQQITGATGQLCNTTAMTGGAGDPDVGSASSGTLAAIAAGGHKILISSMVDGTNGAKLKTYADFVSNSVEQRPVLMVLGYTDLVGSLANAKTLGGTTFNHGRTTIGYLPSAATKTLEVSNYYLAAAYGAVIASEADPARPLNNMKLNGIPAPVIDDRLTRANQEDLLNNGVVPLIVDAGENVVICRAISTYVTNSAGIPDPSLLDITTIRTLDYTREATRQRLALRFPRNKLSTRTPGSVKAEVLDVLYILEQLEILENVTGNEDQVIVERDSQDTNRLNIRIPADVVNGLHVIAERIDLIL